MAEQVRRRPFLTLACPPESAIVCFRATPAWIEADRWDAWNSGLHDAIVSRTGIHLSFVPYGDARWLRAVFSNPFTAVSVVDRVFAVVDEYAAESRKGRP